MRKFIALITVACSIMWCFSAAVYAAPSGGKLSVVSERGTIEGGQKGSVRLIYNGAGVDGIYAQISYSNKIITKPVMSESVSGVECEITDDTITVVYINAEGTYPDDGAVRICKFDFEVVDGAQTGKTLGFEIKNAKAAIKTGDIASTAELETSTQAVVITPDTQEGRLAAVEIKGARITPEFSPYIRNYQVVIPSSMSSVTINVVPQNPEAVIEGDGSVTVYRRNRNIIVKNPDGETFEYNFTISLDDYRSYSNSKIWKFIEKSGLYFAGILALGFAGFSIFRRVKVKKGDEVKDE